MAAVVLRQLLETMGLGDRVVVTSAGVESWNVGGRADRRVRAVLERHGYDSRHTAGQLSPYHLRADYLIAMDSANYRALQRLAPEHKNILMFRTLAPGPEASADVPDPYTRDDSAFDDLLGTMETVLPTLVETIAAGLRPAECRGRVHA
jgi:protein-tyrosine phosphatase